MIRAFAAAALITGLVAFAQAPKGGGKEIPPGFVDPEHDPRNQGTEEQKCQMVCGEAMSKCMMPCMGGNPEEAAKPENRSKTMACVKKCSDGQEPCMKGCEAKRKK